ncbi:hypothetical protein [Xenorhabdus sp. SGI246]|uniref:hypothetical protein n=1 Tax=Xenorhabdus sp. SGI246 TaxID=3158263 RepID=UPI00349FCBE8
MSLDVAYSLEIEDFIDADRAYEFYWAGLITSKKAFICPGENCRAQVTCANIDEETQKMKVVPHFRVYGDHDESCEVFNKVPLKITEVILENNNTEKKSIDLSVVDSFLLVRPPSYYEVNDKKIDFKLEDLKRNIKYKNKNISYNLKQIGFIGNVYSVRTIVSRFLRYSSDNTISNRSINISGMNIPYSSFLKLIWEQKLEDLPEYGLIYYGWAYVDRHEKGYKIKFKKGFKNELDEILPVSLYIGDKLIEKYPIKKLVTKRLSSISAEIKPTAFVFVYGKPRIYKSPKTLKEYVNFDLYNLDMVDVNKETPLPKKK